MGVAHSTAVEASIPGGEQKQSARIGVVSSMDTVLVVEDSRPMQRTLQRLFESDMLQVHIAPDGPSGLEIFRKQLPSVVVLDLKLPGISGKDLCREFKTIAASVPIVVLSANSEVEDKVLLLELGADDYVTKPFSPKELLARVRRAMRRSSSSQSAQQTVSPVATRRVNREVLVFGDARIDFTIMEATRAGKSIILNTQELKLLKNLEIGREHD
jgi:DNA-binding response OmpR family regulator